MRSVCANVHCMSLHVLLVKRGRRAGIWSLDLLARQKHKDRIPKPDSEATPLPDQGSNRIYFLTPAAVTAASNALCTPGLLVPWFTSVALL